MNWKKWEGRKDVWSVGFFYLGLNSAMSRVTLSCEEWVQTLDSWEYNSTFRISLFVFFECLLIVSIYFHKHTVFKKKLFFPFFFLFFCVKFSYSKVETWEIIFRCTFERVAGVFLNFIFSYFFFFTFELIDVCEWNGDVWMLFNKNHFVLSLWNILFLSSEKCSV